MDDFLFSGALHQTTTHETPATVSSVDAQDDGLHQSSPVNSDLDVLDLDVALQSRVSSSVMMSKTLSANLPPPQVWYATVTHIVDGDTFDVVWAPGDEPPPGLLDRVRIAGVDTNETSLNEAFAQAAKIRLAELLPIGTVVRLEAQDENSSTLNRPVRHVFVGNTNIATVMISEGLGLAVSYDFEPDYRNDYFVASENAQVGEIGMWEPGAAGGNPATWPDIDVIVNYDAYGDDALHLNDEYIQIRNNGPGTLDISNWTARSSARLDGATIQVPFGTIIQAGATYRIYVGMGLNTANSMYLGLSEPLFDNTGDVVYLRDTFLNIRATQLWPATITRGPEHSIVIDEVHFDAAGDDAVNPNGEWVKIRNAGDVTVNLTDWRLKDDGFDYAFKNGETLAAGQQLTIFIGTGVDSGSNRYWGNTTGILDNLGQNLDIWTPQSLEVDTFEWGIGTSVGEDPRGAIRMFANFDAAGNDATNPNGEWVSLKNTSDTAINIGGYKLVSGTDIYTFAANTMLAAGANMLVKVGSGTDTTATKFWGKSSGIFANSGDYVNLVDADAATILRHEWPAPFTGVSDYGLVIDSVNFDAPGSDTTNPNGEWIVIRNASLTEQNLQNWQILVGTNQITSLASRVIAPGGTVKIFMGSGTNTADTIYWGKTSGIMSNTGSTPVQLLAPNRELIEYHAWGTGAASPAQSVSAAIDMSFNYDAVGVDTTNLNGEWVNLVNTSSSTISLNGFHLYSDGGSYVFDSGDTLAAGERLRVYRGAGTDSGLARYANGSLPEFANTGDEVELRRNDTGGTADIFSYPSTTTLPTRGQFEFGPVNYDAPGDDSTNPNGEWIDIKNVGTGTANLRDWRIQYQTATFFDFNVNVNVAAGASIRVYMGTGVNTANTFYWGNTAGSLGNLAGSLQLQSNYREVVDNFVWPNTSAALPREALVIDDVQFDAPGDDNTNPNGEWIKIRNASAVTVNLTDWLIKDEIQDYKFKAGETLAAGQSLTIFVGAGVDNGSNRYWGNSTSLLNNTGQKLHIWTADQVEVDTFAWGAETSLNEDPRGAIRMFANFDAAGSDTTNPNGEWISLQNTSDSAINIGGYKVKSGSNEYVFAAGTMLAANANMLLRIGSGVDTADTKFWGKPSGILSNSSGSVDLINGSAATLLRHTWPTAFPGVTDFGIVIDHVNYDALGDDATNPNGEWIRIRNASSAEQNLLNWQVLIGTEQVNILNSLPLAAGATLTIYMGSGVNTANTLYLGKTAGIIANDGTQTVQLLAPSREVTELHGWGVAAANANQSVSAAIDMSINYDAVGDDAFNPNGEWVNLVNTSSSTVSLNGYHLYTDGTTYLFDAGDTLAAGERMRVYRGAGTDVLLDRYANSGLNDFANTGDEIELRRNDTGGLADLFSFIPNVQPLPTRGQFTITGVNYDAVGNDATNPNGEWIDITNTGPDAANLRDWRIQYASATFFDFNSNVIVAAGATIRLYMGSGTNTATALYWGNAGGILSNTTGSLILQSNYRESASVFNW